MTVSIVTRRYLQSLYWTVITMSTIGFGDISPQTPPQAVFAICLMIVGVCATRVVVYLLENCLLRSRVHWIFKLNIFMFVTSCHAKRCTYPICNLMVAFKLRMCLPRSPQVTVFCGLISYATLLVKKTSSELDPQEDEFEYRVCVRMWLFMIGRIMGLFHHNGHGNDNKWQFICMRIDRSR